MQPEASPAASPCPVMGEGSGSTTIQSILSTVDLRTNAEALLARVQFCASPRTMGAASRRSLVSFFFCACSAGRESTPRWSDCLSARVHGPLAARFGDSQRQGGANGQVREYMSRQKGGALQNPRQQQLRTMQQQQQQQGMLNPQQGGQMSQQGASPQQQQQQQVRSTPIRAHKG